MSQIITNSSSEGHLVDEELRSDSFDMVIYRMIGDLASKFLSI
jgi:hypothetical protein